MKRKTTWFAAVGIAASAASVARADGPILLGTMRTTVVIGRPHVSASYSPVLYYRLGPQPGDTIVLFEELAAPSEYPATITGTTSALDETDFLAFAAVMTNGVDDSLLSGAWGNGGLVGGAGGPESQRLDLLFARYGPDLVGYTIDHIARELTVNAESPGSDPFGDGIWTDWTVGGTYEIYGWPVPEPVTGFLLALPAALLMRGRFQEQRV